MASESFQIMRKRVLREHKHSIVRSALIGHKNKGRGVVHVKFAKRGMVHLSYLTLDTLKHQSNSAFPKDREYWDTLIERISAYHPDCEIPVVVTDGNSQQLSFGVKQAR